MTNTPTPPLAYTVKQVLATLGVGRTTLYALIKAGELTPVKVHGRTLLRHDDLLALLDRKSAGSCKP